MSFSSPHNQSPILTVSQLTNAIKLCLEGTFPTIWLQGEVSNCKLQTSGHYYFSLKDSNAQIAAVMFRTDALLLKIPPKDGDQVTVKGEMNVYPPTGKYQLIVREMKQTGLGELLLKLEELKQKLHKKGWFKSSRKKALPSFPRKIGVVTSPTGAAIQDILNILSRRFSSFHLILNPVRVQGEGAAQEIAEAIKFFNKYHLVDVLIVGRGGGSIEDLWAFNEELVAEAIFQSEIPIISAVGHETDHCIADYVADVRAPTPSAAAEMVITEKAQQLKQLAHMHRNLRQALMHLIRKDRHRLITLCRQPIFLSPYPLLGNWIQKMDQMRNDSDFKMAQIIGHYRLLIEGMKKQAHSLKPMNQIAYFKNRLLSWEQMIDLGFKRKIDSLKKACEHAYDKLDKGWIFQQENRRRMFSTRALVRELAQSWQHFFNSNKNKLTRLEQTLHAVDPKNVLKKGYCILFSEKDHSVITSIQSVKKKDEMRLILSDGEILSTVKETFPK